MVEGVRLIFIALFGTAGFLAGGTFASESTSLALALHLPGRRGRVRDRRGRRAPDPPRGAVVMEQELRRKPAPQLAGGVVGFIISLVVAALLMVPLLFVPARRGVAGDRVRLPRVSAHWASVWVKRSTRTSSGWSA